MAFDSREYEYADLTAVVGGKDLTGLRGLSYDEEQDKDLVYGKGNKPRKIQKGNIKYSGELSVLQSEYETMVANSPNKSILGLQINIVAAYGNPSNGDIVIVDILQAVQFTKAPKALKQGDKFQEIKLPFIFLNIKPQVA